MQGARLEESIVRIIEELPDAVEHTIGEAMRAFGVAMMALDCKCTRRSR